MKLRRKFIVSIGLPIFILSIAFVSLRGCNTIQSLAHIVSLSSRQCSRPSDIGQQGGCVALLTGHMSAATGTAFSPDGRLVATNAGGQVRLWEVLSGKSVASLGKRRGLSYGVAFSPDGSLIAAAQDTTVTIWRKQKVLYSLDLRINELNNITFSQDGLMLAAGGSGGQMYLWDAVDGSKLHTWQAHTQDITGVAFAPDGSTFASSAYDNTVKIWRVVDGSLLRTITTTKGSNDVAFAPDGTMLVTVGYGIVQLWRMPDGSLIREIKVESIHQVTRVVFSPNGTFLAIGGDAQNNEVQLWQVSNGTLAYTLPKLPAHGSYAVNSLAFSSDGALLTVDGVAIGDGLDNVLIWKLPQ